MLTEASSSRSSRSSINFSPYNLVLIYRGRESPTKLIFTFGAALPPCSPHGARQTLMLFLELNRSLHFTDIIIMGTETACTPAAMPGSARHRHGRGGPPVGQRRGRHRDRQQLALARPRRLWRGRAHRRQGGCGGGLRGRLGRQRLLPRRLAEGEGLALERERHVAVAHRRGALSRRGARARESQGGALGGSAGLLRQRFELPCGDLASFEAEQGRGEPLPPVDNHELGRAEVRRLAPDARRAPLRDNRGRRPW